MATLRQKKLAMNIVEAMKMDEMPTQTDLLVSAGYSPATAEASSSRQIELKGVREELKKLGFSIEAADKVVTTLLQSDDEAIQIKASQEVYKRLGAYAPDKSQNLNVEVKVDAKEMNKHEALRKKYEDELRNNLLNEE